MANATTDLAALIDHFSMPATELNMTPADKRDLIDDICDCLSIGKWCAPEAHTNFDVSLDDIEDEWSKIENEAFEADNYLSAYCVALLLATHWEYEAQVCASDLSCTSHTKSV